MAKKVLDSLEALSRRMDQDLLTQEDFIKSFENLLNFLISAIKKLEEKNRKTEDGLRALAEELSGQLEMSNSERIAKGETTLSEKFGKLEKDHLNLMNFIRDKVRELRSGEDGADGEDGKDADPEEVAAIVLKRLPEAKESELPKELLKKIDDLEEEIKTIKRAAASSSQNRVMTPRYTYTPLVDDFSGDTDGSTKTFTLSKAPKSITKMLVWGSDFPTILRPTTDFTIAGKTLTLTSQVDAPSNGATLIAMYYV